MARWPELVFITAALTVPARLDASTPRPVEPIALASGALACRGLPDDFAVAGRRMVELGWPRAAPGGGRANEAPLPMFERDGLTLMLTPPDDAGHPTSCAILATVRRSVTDADLTAAVSAAFGRQPGPDQAAGAPVWQLEGGQVMALMTDGHGGVLLTFWHPRDGAH